MKFIAGISTITATTIRDNDKIEFSDYIVSFNYNRSNNKIIIRSAEYIDWFLKNNCYVLHINFSLYDSNTAKKEDTKFYKNYFVEFVDSYVEHSCINEPSEFIMEFKVL